MEKKYCSTYIYKNEENTQSCNNYPGIKLTSRTMKLYERRQKTKISKNQFGQMAGISTIDAIFSLR